jgi:hypothetical protein
MGSFFEKEESNNNAEVEDEVEDETEQDIEPDVEVNTESEPEPESYDIIISPETFDRFASVIGFLFGLLINWGSLNILGFMIGLNYKYLLVSASYNKILTEVQTIIPAFMLGVLIVHLSLIYFAISIFIGYIVKSKNLNFVNDDFLKRNSININVSNYRGVFYELLGIFGQDTKKES